MKSKKLSNSLEAYETGAGSVGLPWLCLYSAATGLGGAASFAGSIKTCKILIYYSALFLFCRSCFELARTSRHCNGLPASSIWAQCIRLLFVIFGVRRRHRPFPPASGCWYICFMLRRFLLPSCRSTYNVILCDTHRRGSEA